VAYLPVPPVPGTHPGGTPSSQWVPRTLRLRYLPYSGAEKSGADTRVGGSGRAEGNDIGHRFSLSCGFQTA
jgi:hypothetical protein